MIERNIDYLQLNVHLNERDFNDASFDQIYPIKFYKRGYRSLNGVRFFFGNPNSEKCHVVMGGYALMFERLLYPDESSLLEHWLTQGAIVSRIDLAVTDFIEDDFCTMDDVKSWVIKGEIDSRWMDGGAKGLVDIIPETGEQLETLYIGSIPDRGKKGIFRAYDKGIQSGVLSDIITRLEAEIRGESAHSVSRRLVQSGDIAGEFRAKFNCTSPQFERLIESPAANTSRGASLPQRDQDTKMQARWHWLINTVAPALKEAIDYDRQIDSLDVNLVKFLAASNLHDELKRYAKSLADRMYADKLSDNEIIP